MQGDQHEQRYGGMEINGIFSSVFTEGKADMRL